MSNPHRWRLAAIVVAAWTCQPVAAQVSTPRPSSASTPTVASPQGATRVVQQGFSVVLVVADFQGSGSQDDVPPAAKRALADMRDFLPYKSYRLIDAAWILGQQYTRSTSRLRGPENQDYELRLESSPVSGGISVKFSLSEAGTPAPGSTATDRAAVYNRREQLKAQLDEARRAGKQDAVRKLEAQIADLERQTSLQARHPESMAKTRPDGAHTVIDTIFTMQVGETVVVGTSRLRENNKALIALLTAVPARVGTREQ